MDQFTAPSEGDAPGEVGKDRADQWVRFYEELIEFESSILVTMEERSVNLPTKERDFIERSNLAPMRKLIADFRSRLEVWRTAAEASEPRSGEGGS